MGVSNKFLDTPNFVRSCITRGIYAELTYFKYLSNQPKNSLFQTNEF